MPKSVSDSRTIQLRYPRMHSSGMCYESSKSFRIGEFVSKVLNSSNPNICQFVAMRGIRDLYGIGVLIKISQIYLDVVGTARYQTDIVRTIEGLWK